MLERLVPDFVACAETTEDQVEIELYLSERRSLGNAVEKRRREFSAGRACARRALQRLGVPAQPIASGSHGEPLWPAGVVGSITHCPGFRACAVAARQAAASVGIDAEPNSPLPAGVLEDVAHGRELEQMSRRGPVDLGRLLFSAKEAVYKAWFPLTRRWLGFDEVEMTLDAVRGELRAELLVPGPVVGGTELTELRGRWGLQDGIICTAVVIPARGQG